MEYHTQFVTCLVDHSSHIIFPGTVHVADFSQLGAVQIQICNRINSVKMKNLMFCLHYFRLTVKYDMIFVIFIHQFQRFVFIILEKRIFHLSIAQQICIDGSGNNCFPEFLISYTAHAPVLI